MSFWAKIKLTISVFLKYRKVLPVLEFTPDQWATIQTKIDAGKATAVAKATADAAVTALQTQLTAAQQTQSVAVAADQAADLDFQTTLQNMEVSPAPATT